MSVTPEVLAELRALYDEAESYALDAGDGLGARAQEVRFRLMALAMQHLPALLDEIEEGRTPSILTRLNQAVSLHEVEDG
jgi:hypothetical protein